MSSLHNMHAFGLNDVLIKEYKPTQDSKTHDRLGNTAYQQEAILHVIKGFIHLDRPQPFQVSGSSFSYRQTGVVYASNEGAEWLGFIKPNSRLFVVVRNDTLFMSHEQTEFRVTSMSCFSTRSKRKDNHDLEFAFYIERVYG